VFCVQKFFFRKERKKKQKIKPKINVFFFFGDVSSTGRATCTRTAVDNTDDFPRPNARVLPSLEQRTHHERVKNERMHETAFDSIAPVLSFVLFSHPSARENARAKVNSHFSHRRRHPTWKTSSIRDFSSTARARVV
jgi:hypothetical protein